MFTLKSNLARTMILMAAIGVVAGLSRVARAGDETTSWKKQEQNPDTAAHRIVKVLEPDGEDWKIERRSSIQFDPESDVAPRLVPISRIVAHDSGAKPSGLWKSMEKDLEEAGFDAEQLKQVRKALDAAWKARDGKWVIQGKINVLGPDGAVEEIDLARKDIEWQLHKDLYDKATHLLVAQPGRQQKYMIGVECMNVDDTLRSQLQLDEGVGLLVKSVLDGTPAKKVGIRKNDFLIRADERKLSETTDLIEAVQAAGRDEKELSLLLIRDGEKRTIKVTPVERESIGFAISDWRAQDSRRREGGGWLSIGPAWTVRPPAPENGEALKKLAEKIEQISRKLDRVQEELTELKKQR